VIANPAFAPARTPLAREAFVLERGTTYWDHARAGVIPIRTRDALMDAVWRCASRGAFDSSFFKEESDAARACVAAFIGVRAEDITFTRDAYDGADAIVRGLDWKRGDEVVLGASELSGAASPWFTLLERGVGVHCVGAGERLTSDALARLMTSRTRMVIVPWVCVVDGYRHDLAALAEIAHVYDALFCVDATQGLGAFSLDAGWLGIDALYADCSTWLMALQGTGILSMSPRMRGRLEQAPFASSMRRCERGIAHSLGILSLRHAIAVLEEAGMTRISDHILGLTDYLVEDLRRIGARIDSPRGTGTSSGIVTFRFPRRDSAQVWDRLKEAKIVTSSRSGVLCAAPHGYNTYEEADALLSVVSERQ
jgi:selenocysteine lyase/cysteine desulfurase